METIYISSFIAFVLICNVSDGQKVTVPDPSAKRYLTYELYSFCPDEKIYCREGSRGPCGEDQVTVEQIDFTENHFYQLDCEFSENADCTTELTNSTEYSNGTGICIWSNQDHPCYGYPASYRLYPENGQCYSVQERFSPQCKVNQKFYSLNNFNGICDCDQDDIHGTGYIYWHETDECYQINNQGPCSPGEWLVLNSSGNGTCVETPCPADGNQVLYSNGEEDARCYELFSEEPCTSEDSPGMVLQRVQIFPEKIECAYRLAFAVAQALAREHDCQPGSKLSASGECKKVFG